MLRQGLQQGEPLGQRVADADAARVLTVGFDGLEQLGLGLLAHARQRGDVAAQGRGLELVHRADAQLLVDQRDGLGPQPGDPGQLEQPVRDRRLQRDVVLTVAGLEDLLDPTQAAVRHPWHLGQRASTHHGGCSLRQRLHGLRHPSEGPNTKWVFSLDLKYGGHLVEDPCHLLVLHQCLPLRVRQRYPYGDLWTMAG